MDGAQTRARSSPAARTGAAPQRRLGPRPLPLHLSVANLTWLSSRAAWPLWRSGSLALNPSLAARADALRQSLASVPPEAFAAALDAEILHRTARLAQAIARYRDHPYRRRLPEPPTLWRDGGLRLLDYGEEGAGAPVLLVPSLVNRPYILDLSARCSLVRWLAAAGFRPLLVDWGDPEAERCDFTLTDYVADSLEAALDAVLAATGRAPLVAGYCMGGLLALALALRRQRDVAALALLATPWDFHAGGAGQRAVAQASLLAFGPMIDLLKVLPVDAIQTLFAAVDPQTAVRKFLAFGAMDPESARAESFVALEDWLNDGVALAAPVARECLGGWYVENTPARGRWRIAGRAVDPGALSIPTLSVIPAQDRIVPPASSLALAAAIPRGTVQRPPAGHIGMVASARAPQTVWRALADWLAAPG